jgi:hypothetical protein
VARTSAAGIGTGGFSDTLMALDAAVGVRWRPAYAGVAAPEAEPAHDREALTVAHQAYRRALEGHAADPEGVGRLAAPERALIGDALADARERFGRHAVPLDHLLALLDSAPAAPAAGIVPAAPVAVTPAAARAASPKRSGPSSPDPDRGPDRPSGRGRLAAFTMGSISLLVIAGVAFLLTRLLSPPAAGPAPLAATPATLPPVGTVAGTPPDVVAFTARCAAPGGAVAGLPAIRAASSDVLTDPVTQLQEPAVALELDHAPAAGSAPFSITVVVLPFSATPPAAATVADAAGTVQLLAFWDGHLWHRGLRTWTGSAWSTAVDVTVQGMDLATTGANVTLYWEGLGSGARFGEVVAGAGGCAAHDLDGGNPQQTYAG